MSLTELPEIPLTLFEKYFLLDASNEFPMLVDGVFHFSGHFESMKFEEAVHECLERQPLLLRKIEKKGRRFYWVPWNDSFEIQWLKTPPNINGPEWNEPIDLFQRNGLDLYVYHHGNETKIYYRCHHICTDGVGFYRFISEVLTVYAIKCASPIKLSKPVVARRILDRADFKPKELPKKIGFFKIIYETIREIVRWIREKPIYIGQRKNETPDSRFGRKTYVIDAEIIERYRVKIKSVDCTLNDLLLAAFFKLLWNQETKETVEQKGNRMRLMIPVNMRWPGSDDIPATNIISYVFLTKKKFDCNVGSDLLSTIHDEMQIIKNYQVGYMFFDALRFFDCIPGGLRMMTGGKSCLAGMVFSNMGSIERCFDNVFSNTESGVVNIAGLQLEFVESYAPCRHLTNISIAATLQSGKLVLCCEYDRLYLSENELDRMIGEYETTLNDLSQKEDK